MQAKNIAKKIRTKMDEWLKTITDEKLRDDVRKNLLVSGGSITSLYLNENVNDYDVYIQSKDVCTRLARYYLAGKDIPVIVSEMNPSQLRNTWLSEEEQETAGRWNIALTTCKENQVKIYVPDGVGIKYDTTEDYQLQFISPNAISLSGDIQIVCRFTGTPEEIHASFDFIHATNYFTMKDGLVRNLNAVESILTKSLRYQGSMYPVTSVIRTKKFLKRGWKCSAGEYLKILYQVSFLDLSDPLVLEEQLVGVDVAYFGIIIEALRNTKKEELSPTFVSTLIDRVFNEEDEHD